jgi:hypothetical protein
MKAIESLVLRQSLKDIITALVKYHSKNNGKVMNDLIKGKALWVYALFNFKSQI